MARIDVGATVVSQSFQIVVDAIEPLKVGAFWRTALGYVAEPPPSGYPSWQDFATANEIPPERWADSAVDPEGIGPRLYFQPVPEAKTVKNRLHLDINAGAGVSGAERRRRVDDEVARLVNAGARVVTTVEEYGGYFVVMHDPEDNEFCVQ